MIGLDTNVLVRYLVQDHPAQARRAAEFIEKKCTREDPGLISEVVLCELAWVLESAYAFKKDAIAEAIEKILMTVQFRIANHDIVRSAIEAWRKSEGDFADCLIGKRNRALGCDRTATFDKALGGLPEFLII